jgi:hypothetical protein
MMKTVTGRFLILVIIAAIVLAACGQSAEEPEFAEAPAEEAAEAIEVTRIITEVEEVVVVEEEAPAEEPAVAEEPAPPEPAEPGVAGVAAPAEQQQVRLIIKDGRMMLIVVDTEAAVDGATRLIDGLGGYIIEQRAYDDADGYRFANLRLAVPVERFEEAMRRLRSLGDVIDESSSGEDVTEEFVDLQSRLENLEVTRERLRQLLEETNTVEEALEVDRQLRIIEEEIAVIQGRINFLAQRAAFSTIDLTIEPLIPTPTPSPTPTTTPTPTPTPIPTPETWRPGDTVQVAAVQLQDTFQNIADAVIYGGIFCGPWLLLLALIGVPLWLIARRRGVRAPWRRPAESEGAEDAAAPPGEEE